MDLDGAARARWRGRWANKEAPYVTRNLLRGREMRATLAQRLTLAHTRTSLVKQMKASLTLWIASVGILTALTAEAKVFDVSWNSEVINKTEKSMGFGDVIQIRDPDGSISISCTMTPIYRSASDHPSPATISALEGEAVHGSACEKHSLGFFYSEGNGVVKDQNKSNRWFALAAKQGYASSFISIGIILQHGWGVPKNPLKAKHWFEKAVKHGHSGGEEALGLLYRDGDGDDFPVDRQEAMKWMLRAAEHGVSYAQLVVGGFYMNGFGAPRDPIKALEWLTKAYENGENRAPNNIAVLYHNGLFGKNDYKMARTWYQRGADLNDPMGLMGLWKLYHAGLGVKQDDAKAIQYLRRATELKLPIAYQAMGECSDRGYGLPREPRTALAWYEKAADAGVPGAALIVGHRYEYPDTEGHLGRVAPDPSKALKWYLKAVEQNKDPTAAEEAGDIYTDGYGIPKDLTAAFQMYSIAAESGIAQSQDILADMYMDGSGVSQSVSMSLKWRQRAADRGFARAQYEIAKLFRQGKHGVARDKVEAFNWMLAAALQGDVRAEKDLAAMYKNGEGVDADDAKAFRWKTISERETAEIPKSAAEIYGSVGGQPTKSPEMTRFVKWAMDRQKRAQASVRRF
jgi:uncharacterized protein